MANEIVRTVKTYDGEITVYRDADGFHAEKWSESRQMIVAQSGDQPTEQEAIDRVS